MQTEGVQVGVIGLAIEDDEQLPRRIGGEEDWHINDKLGRWQFEVEGWPPNKVQFKIDKRGQVSGYALD